MGPSATKRMASEPRQQDIAVRRLLRRGGGPDFGVGPSRGHGGTIPPQPRWVRSRFSGCSPQHRSVRATAGGRTLHVHHHTDQEGCGDSGTCQHDLLRPDSVRRVRVWQDGEHEVDGWQFNYDLAQEKKRGLGRRSTISIHLSSRFLPECIHGHIATTSATVGNFTRPWRACCTVPNP